MKIPLQVHRDGASSTKAAQSRALEKEILAAKKGDWKPKNGLIRTFTPLLTSLAEKRTSDPAELNRLMEAGKEGIAMAIKKYRTDVGPDQFQVFALDFIEAQMDGKKQGFFARLFGGR